MVSENLGTIMNTSNDRNFLFLFNAGGAFLLMMLKCRQFSTALLPFKLISKLTSPESARGS